MRPPYRDIDREVATAELFMMLNPGCNVYVSWTDKECVIPPKGWKDKISEKGEDKNEQL